ncbi:hypothetical protein GF323_02735 [Candidatus Woesearchaeota archaeon]|nr:hypothetical protein [Candidatus Woesearchaeota archaeon]
MNPEEHNKKVISGEIESLYSLSQKEINEYMVKINDADASIIILGGRSGRIIPAAQLVQAYLKAFDRSPRILFTGGVVQHPEKVSPFMMYDRIKGMYECDSNIRLFEDYVLSRMSESNAAKVRENIHGERESRRTLENYIALKRHNLLSVDAYAIISEKEHLSRAERMLKDVAGPGVEIIPIAAGRSSITKRLMNGAVSVLFGLEMRIMKIQPGDYERLAGHFSDKPAGLPPSGCLYNMATLLKMS